MSDEPEPDVCSECRGLLDPDDDDSGVCRICKRELECEHARWFYVHIESLSESIEQLALVASCAHGGGMAPHQRQLARALLDALLVYRADELAALRNLVGGREDDLDS
jgi:hypothetical protein